ncbi:hypothetical protein THAOC_09373 [Thalassiosira oceanica]|uniref:ShKT domain-containing protein n=1 Tax=Thalassiosira oceanica TaxID=159749 RepID=K0SSQ7_THAOC|nr:hypothetical protein THAOC_09373 [Thalassiosira oceanica]|mmetsp:Transcript_12955/g.30620  ORF Transcript_12955/g.30620 Transcript_12955/m.30620 type:complete len:341 (-) Transcript_12955:76-1098(-)|eukprot:EJK69373.1 hypothetical protein THAOC_09373 [Thalassiosira oceanica]
MNLHPSDHSSGAAPGPNSLSQDYVVGLFKSTRRNSGENGELSLHQIRGTVSGRGRGSRRRVLAIAGLVMMFVVVVVTSVGRGNKGAQKASATGSSGQGMRGGYGSSLPAVPEEGEQVHDNRDTDQTLGRTTVNEAIDNSDKVDQPLRGTTDSEALDNSEEESGQTGVPSVNENGDCNDDPNFKFYDAATVTNCADYVGRLDRSVMQGVLELRCNLPWRHQGTDHLVSQYCRKSCGKCSSDQGQATSPQTEDAVGPTQSTDVNATVSSHSGDQITSTAVGCADDPTFVFYHDGTPTDCNTFVANVPKSSLLKDRCGVNFISEDGLMTKLSQSCRKSCHVCT